MTKAQKEKWAMEQTNEKLLDTLYNLQFHNEYGEKDESIQIIKDEILFRMSKF